MSAGDPRNTMKASAAFAVSLSSPPNRRLCWSDILIGIVASKPSRNPSAMLGPSEGLVHSQDQEELLGL